MYMDDLIVRFRKAGVGCHVGGVVGYADDLCLLAPSRSAMEVMLRICEDFATENNLQFSTDPDPEKSKSNCIFLQGYRKLPKPANLKLYGLSLPWVKTANHLGHELSEECNMVQDMAIKRADFIQKSTEVRETFAFAKPNQILQCVTTYCTSMYGAMTWPLFSDKASQVFNCWSTCVKLAWDVPRATHKYFVDNLLAGGTPSLRSSILARYMKFFHSLRLSNSLAVRVVANLCSKDVRSATGSNLTNIAKEVKLDPVWDQVTKVKNALLSMKTLVPRVDGWRVGCLQKFLAQRHKMTAMHQDTDAMDKLIDCLCTT